MAAGGPIVDIIIKSIVGGIMTGIIAWAAKRGNILPDILPLFPTLGLIALYLVGAKGDTSGFRQACTAAIKTLPAYLAFLVVTYHAIQKTDFRIALGAGVAAWLITAVGTILGPRLL
jgi:uncharacterized membrane protein (GlpM family)